MRTTDVASRRRELRLLGVGADGLCGQLEQELFLAHQRRAIGRIVCPDCTGSGDGELIDRGTCLVPSSCDACDGTEFVSAR